tara:strand:- start:24 stop:569 length:546 start_codon:yes stop_codon:yes gene_type:complete
MASNVVDNDGNNPTNTTAPFNATTVKTVSKIPLMTINAGPRDGDLWNKRLKEEFTALILYIKNNKAEDNDWFNIKPKDKTGTFWEGKCWNYYKGLKYEFKLQFAIPATYPSAAPELAVPELEGKTAKMYRGGKICLDIHFNPLWQKNVPKFGIAHAIALGLGPWLAAEVPDLVEKKIIVHS